jgi:hypothetical protein
MNKHIIELPNIECLTDCSEAKIPEYSNEDLNKDSVITIPIIPSFLRSECIDLNKDDSIDIDELDWSEGNE